MKIVEARDGFIKIETEKALKISSFLEIKGLEKRYIAQVVRVKDNGAGYTVYAKILFIYDGSLIKYDKTLPSVTSEIMPFSLDIINNSFNCISPVVAGKFIENGEDIILGQESFNNSLLISADTPEVNNVIVSNLAKQFNKSEKVVIIDMLGIINDNKYVAGRDFKLPLNKDSLEFLYEDCLKDATQDSKSTIKDIFKDLSEYSEAVQFLPFNTLKSIVDDMVEKSHIFKLLVLKNKLDKFDKLGYFASGKTEADNLARLLDSNFVVIDLSQVEPVFQNRYLSLIYSELCKLKSNVRVFLEASNAVNKKNIKSYIYPQDNVNTIFVTHSKFKYLSELKNFFKNYFIENSYTNNEIFKLYSFFLSSISSKYYLIVGEGTNYIPLISKVEKFDIVKAPSVPDVTADEVINSSYDSDIPENSEITEPDELNSDISVENTIQEDTQIDDLPAVTEENTIVEDNSSANTDNGQIEEDFHTTVDTTTSVEIASEIDDIREPDIIQQENITENKPEPITEQVEEELETPNITNSEIAIEENIISEEDLTLEEEETTEESIIDASNEEMTEENTEAAEDTEDEIAIPSDLEQEYNEVKDIDNEPEYLEQSESLNEKEEIFTEPEIMPLENQDSDFEDIIELDVSEIGDDDILVDLADDEELPDAKPELTPEELDKEITEDVDKVFTTIKDDSISDSDLDFIDELNDTSLEQGDDSQEIFDSGDMETLESLSEDDDDGFLEPLQEVSDNDELKEEKDVLEKRDTSTPIVPVYDAEIPEEDKIMSDYVEQGDNVIHAKYGSGVVEKVIKYGNKTLHSINFDNVGRRLLDLEITEVKKA